MKDDLLAATHAFVKAISLQDVSALSMLLHSDFRVVANQFPNPGELTLIKREKYLQLMSSKKLGGEPYALRIEQLILHHTSGIVQATLQGPKSVMKVFLSFLQSPSGEWQLIANLPEINR